MHCGVSVSEVADCIVATSHSSRARQTRGGYIWNTVLRLCSLSVSKSGNRESGVGASVAFHCVSVSKMRAPMS